jgi:hypothetical protein
LFSGWISQAMSSASARTRARPARRRQQRRLGVGLVEVFDDGQRLRQHLLAVAQQRHQPAADTAA